MVTVSRFEPDTPQHASGWRVPRSRGALNGLLLVLLGLWGALIPFLGQRFGFAYTPNSPGTLTSSRLWLELVPGAVTAVGGLGLLGAGHRASGVLWSWVAAVGGAWFVVGPVVSRLWNGGEPDVGTPAGHTTIARVLQELAFFSGLGTVIVFLAAVGLGRFTVKSARNAARVGTSTPTEEVPTQRLRTDDRPQAEGQPRTAEASAVPTTGGTGAHTARHGEDTGRTEGFLPPR